MTLGISAPQPSGRIKELELRGYTVLPGLLDSTQLSELRGALENIQLRQSS